MQQYGAHCRFSQQETCLFGNVHLTADLLFIDTTKIEPINAPAGAVITVKTANGKEIQFKGIKPG